jgi:hypothetical protein
MGCLLEGANQPGAAQGLPRTGLGDARCTVELRIPKLRNGSYFRGFLEPWRLAIISSVIVAASAKALLW